MKILYVTTIGMTMMFFKDLIEDLVKNGHTVDIATNDSESKVDSFYKELGCEIITLSCSRSPLKRDNLTAIKQIKKRVEEQKYDIVHCHTPVAAMCTRLACRKLRKNGVRVFYTAHGFHFHKGAPLKNWLLYYPVEWACSFFTDVLITINKEDYKLAKNKFKAKEVHCVPGVGVDLSRFKNVQVDRAVKRQEIGVPDDAFLLLSVGELNKNKNHQIIIRALDKLNNPKVHYAIAGSGDEKEYLLKLADELGVSEQVHLLGYRNDIPELNYSADVFCFPSKREGLGLAAVEAMACGVPVVTSNVHGINDYSIDGVTGFKCTPSDDKKIAEVIKGLIDDPQVGTVMGRYNIDLVQKYDVKRINAIMSKIYLQ